MDNTAVIISDLSKRYGRKGTLAFHDINLRIPENTVLALLGGNGSGKSSLLEVLAGIRRPTTGSVTVFGRDPFLNRSGIGYLPQDFSLFKELTAEENIRYFMRINGKDGDIGSILETYGVSGFSKKRYNSLSGGMKRRTEIACILASDPKMIIMDEPTSGLDIDSCRELWEMVRRLKNSGKTLIIASHDMHDAISHSDMTLYLKDGVQTELPEADP